eukprot:881848-Prymnesium_polylepis.2
MPGSRRSNVVATWPMASGGSDSKSPSSQVLLELAAAWAMRDRPSVPRQKLRLASLSHVASGHGATDVMSDNSISMAELEGSSIPTGPTVRRVSESHQPQWATTVNDARHTAARHIPCGHLATQIAGVQQLSRRVEQHARHGTRARESMHQNSDMNVPYVHLVGGSNKQVGLRSRTGVRASGGQRLGVDETAHHVVALKDKTALATLDIPHHRFVASVAREKSVC